MWATFALAAALIPAQAGTLELTNVRVAHGVLGQERKDTKVLPGDLLVVTFDITGLEVAADGRVRYRMGMELTRKGKPKPEFKNDPEVKESVLTLGGNSLPNQAFSVIGLDTPPGEYDMKVTVEDLGKTRQTKTLVRSFEVLPPQLGFVRVSTTYETGQPAPLVAVPGQTLLVNFWAVGFKVDDKGNPDIVIEMQILDEAGKPTVGKPFTGEVKKIIKAEFAKYIPFDPIPLHLNRPGKYKIVLKVTDNLNGKKTAEQTLNLTVLDTSKAG